MVDVEGAELPVLQGCSFGRIKNAAMFIEMHPYAWSQMGYEPCEMDKYLIENNFLCVDMFHRVHEGFENDPWYPDYIGPTKFFRVG